MLKHSSIMTWSSITHTVEMRQLENVKCIIYVKIVEKLRKTTQKCVFSHKTIKIFGCKAFQHYNLFSYNTYSEN